MPRSQTQAARWRAMVALGAAAGAALTLGACRQADDQRPGRQETRQTVVLYVSTDEYLARQVIAAFEEQTGIGVEMVGDTEAKKTTELVQRLRSEADHPQADVFWSNEIFMTIALADDGVLEPYESPATADWPAVHRDHDKRWYAFAARARVIAYAPDRVEPEDVPRTWTDLTKSYLKGRIVMADPRFGTTGGHLAAMKAYWDRTVAPGYYEAFLIGLRDNEMRMLPSGNAGVVRAIIDGEADTGCTDTDDVWAAQARGAAIDLVYPQHNYGDEPGSGTLLIPNTVARVRGGPNPQAAGVLIDFLLSERVERLLAESDSHNIPLRPSLAEVYSEYAVDDPLQVSYIRAAALREEAVAQAVRILTGPPTEQPDPEARQRILDAESPNPEDDPDHEG